MPAFAQLSAWVTAHKAQAALAGGGVGAVGIGLYRRHKAGSSSTTSNSQVPTDATTASVAPYGADSAGGVPYDPSAFDMDPYGYQAQIAQGIAELNTTLSGMSGDSIHFTGTPIIGPGGLKPHTGGKVTVPSSSPKPKHKKTTNPKSKGHPAAPPAKKPANPRKPKPPRKSAVKHKATVGRPKKRKP